MSREKIADSLENGLLAYVVQFLIIFYAVCFTLETVPSLSKYGLFFEWVDRVLLWIFVGELGLRLLVVAKPGKYIISFYGLVDIVSIVPALIGFDSRAVRLLRLIRLLKMARNEEAVGALRRLKTALSSIKSELFVFGILAAITLYFAAIGIYFFENKVQPEKFSSIPACFWWAIITLTTVGYGDAVPITVGGKMFAGLVMIVGIGVVAIPTGLVTSALAGEFGARRSEEEPEDT